MVDNNKLETISNLFEGKEIRTCKTIMYMLIYK